MNRSVTPNPERDIVAGPISPSKSKLVSSNSTYKSSKSNGATSIKLLNHGCTKRTLPSLSTQSGHPLYGSLNSGRYSHFSLEVAPISAKDERISSAPRGSRSKSRPHHQNQFRTLISGRFHPKRFSRTIKTIAPNSANLANISTTTSPPSAVP